MLTISVFEALVIIIVVVDCSVVAFVYSVVSICITSVVNRVRRAAINNTGFGIGHLLH